MYPVNPPPTIQKPRQPTFEPINPVSCICISFGSGFTVRVSELFQLFVVNVPTTVFDGSSNSDVTNSTTISSSNSYSVTFLMIQGLMTDIATFLISTYTKPSGKPNHPSSGTAADPTFCSNSGGNFMVLRSCCCLLEKRLSYSIERKEFLS